MEQPELEQQNLAWQKLQRKHKMAEEKQIESKMEEKNSEIKVRDKKEQKQEEKKAQKNKLSAVTLRGLNLRMSAKVGGDICKMIKYKKIDDAIAYIEDVIAMRKPVKMTNREKPHQHGIGIGGAAYPVNSAKDFLKMLKQLKADAIYHELEIEKSIIGECWCDKASRPYKRGGARAKRAHVFIKLNEKKPAKVNKKD